MKRGKLLTMAVMFAVASLAHAGEVLVEAPVVNVEPIAGPDRRVLECPDKPSGTLSEVLSWDLRLSCTSRIIPSAHVQGYRVFYRWDDRVHQRVMARDPGETVALRLTVD